MRFVSDDQVVDQKSGQVLEVLAAGLPRCATSSMEAAFQEELNLGPAMHMAHIIPHAKRSKLVIAAMGEQDKRKRQKILHQLFDGYKSSADAPGCFFVEDLIEMYPGVKVVLNKRSSAQAWEHSIRSTIMFFGTKAYHFATWLIPSDYYLYKMCSHALVPYIQTVQGYPGNDFFAAGYYNYFNEMVAEMCQRRGVQMLEFEPSMGWDPLCKFLGKPIPSNSFPHRNDAATVRFVARFLVARGLLAWSALGGAAYLLYRYMR